MKPKAFALLALCVIAALSAVYWSGGRSHPVADKAAQPVPSGGVPVAAGGATGDAAEVPRTKRAERPADASRTGKLDDDFNPAAYQRRSMGDGTSAVTGAASAYVQIPSTNRRAALLPNSLGEYEPQPTLTEETVGVRLRIEDVAPGTPVSIVILDGGSFPDGSGFSKVIKLGSDSQISFRFTTSSNIGFHRVRVLPSGGTARLLDFTASKS